MGDTAHLWNAKAQLKYLRHVISTLPRADVLLVEREPRPTPRTAKQLRGKQLEEPVAACETGGTLRKLADQFGVTPQTVSNLLKRQGITPRWRLTEADVDEAERLYARGLSLERVGDRLGVSGCAVRYRLNKRGVRMRDPHEQGSQA